ncbi:MAG TPA: protein-tyrosine phosphatase family protein [Gammaproteobacteria bacterium]|nr:protein-tyrosine phosphatase family protein [Gammaproteobacteria bacterium]
MYKIGSIGHGFLAIMGRPYIEHEEPASLLNVARLGIQQVVSLLEPGEARSLGLDTERLEVRAQGMGFVSFPIADMGTPRSVEKFADLTHTLFRRVDSGINTLVHCRAGIGRSGLFAAGMLLYAGMDAEQAFAHVTRMRGLRVPENPDQHTWLVSNQNRILDLTRGSDDAG